MTPLRKELDRVASELRAHLEAQRVKRQDPTNRAYHCAVVRADADLFKGEPWIAAMHIEDGLMRRLMRRKPTYAKFTYARGV